MNKADTYRKFVVPLCQAVGRDVQDSIAEQCPLADGELQFTMPDILKVPLISPHVNVAEIIGKFGGADQLRNAVDQLQSLHYVD